MMSAKMATLVFLKGKVFWNKVYGVKISAHDVTKILSREWNYIVVWRNFNRKNSHKNFFVWTEGIEKDLSTFFNFLVLS